MNVGVITNFHAPAVSHLHEPRIATGIATAFEVTNSLTVNDTGSSATIATLNFTTGTGTDLTLSGDIQAKDLLLLQDSEKLNLILKLLVQMESLIISRQPH